MRRPFCFCVIGLILFEVMLRTPPNLAGQTNSSAFDASVSLPFVGCESGEMAGPPSEPPTSAGADVPSDAKTAGRLALYKTKNSPAVLGPRGWACYGSAGTSGASLSVVPVPLDPPDSQRISAFGIQVTFQWGDTSGRFTVAQVVARVFPAYRSIAEKVIAEHLLPASDFPFGPFPGDRLTYRSDRMVEYETHPRQKGLGTLFAFQPDNDPIRGVAILAGEDGGLNLLHLALRLPPDLNDLSSVIIRQFEEEK